MSMLRLVTPGADQSNARLSEEASLVLRFKKD